MHVTRRNSWAGEPAFSGADPRNRWRARRPRDAGDPIGAALRRCALGVQVGGGAADSLEWSSWWLLERDLFLFAPKKLRNTQVHTEGGDVLRPGKIRPSKEQIFREVLPTLLIAVENERHDDILTAALIAAARVASAGEPEVQRLVVASISKHLNAPSIEVAETAILSLGILASAPGLQTLLDVLEGGAAGCDRLGRTMVSVRMRSFAAIALGLFGERRPEDRQRIAIALMLASQPHGEDDELMVACMIGLGLNPAPLEPALPHAALRPSFIAVSVASRASQVRWLMERTLEPGGKKHRLSSLARAHAMAALARLGAEAKEGTRANVVAGLRKAALARHFSPQTRAAAWIALGEVTCSSSRRHDVLALAALASTAKAGHPLERRLAIMSLARASTRPDPLSGELDGLVHARVAILNRLAKGTKQDQTWAALALGLQAYQLGGEESPAGDRCAAALRNKLAQDRNQSTIGAFAVASALAHLHSDLPTARRATEEALEAFEQTNDPAARSHVALALGMLGERRAAPLLEELLGDSRFQPHPLWSAAVSLDLVGSPAVTVDLIGILKDSRAAITRAAASSALGRVGDHTAVTPLLELMADRSQTSSTRAFSIGGLGVLCDDDRLPWRTPIAHALPYFAATATLWGRGQGVLDIL